MTLLRESARLPHRATSGSSGLDLYACLGPGNHIDLGQDVTLVPTGIAVEAPPGYDLQLRPRSGLGRLGIDVVFGTIDADYRGELLVSMRCFGSRRSYRIADGDRIAQLVVGRVAELAVVQTQELGASRRQSGGYGSTGR